MTLDDNLRNARPEEVKDDIGRRGFLGKSGRAIAGVLAILSGIDVLLPKDAKASEPNWKPVVDYNFPGPLFDSGNVFDYFVRGAATVNNPPLVSREAFRAPNPNPYIENSGILKMNGVSGTYDLFGVNEDSGPKRLTCYINALTMVDGAGCRIELGTNTRSDFILTGVFQPNGGAPVVRTSERKAGGFVSQIGPDIPYAGGSIIERLTKEIDGTTTIEVKIGNNDWQLIGTSNALNGIKCHAVMAPSLKSGFLPEIKRYLLERISASANNWTQYQ